MSNEQTIFPMIVGGPPLPIIEPLQEGCTAGNMELYNQVQHSIDCAIASEGSNVSSLGQATLLATEMNQVPFSCMTNLLTGPFSECGSEIPVSRREAAWNAFSEVTGYRPVDLNQAFTTLSDQQKQIINFTAFYMFVPIFVVITLGICFMIAAGWINGYTGLFLIGLLFIILYGFSVLYRVFVLDFLSSEHQQLQNNIAAAQDNFQNTIAYWPQGLYAVACAVTATGTTGWTCNGSGSINKNCASCNIITDYHELSNKSEKSRKSKGQKSGRSEKNKQKNSTM